jgi:virginiamycin B lyase
MTRYALALALSFLCSADDAEREPSASSEAQTQPASTTVEIREWPVPWASSRPRDPYVDPSGRVWFVGQRSHYAAFLDPETGEFRRYDLPGGAGPHNLIIDDDGIVWYAGNLVSNIGRLDPATGEITTYPMPDPSIRDPHTMTFAPDGTIWFTAQMGNRIGRFEPESGEIRLIAVPTPSARPYGIVVDGEGRPWIVLSGTSKLATVDPSTMTLTEIDLPRAEARPRRVALTPDGMVWYVDYAGGKLGRFDPRSSEFREWDAPAGAASHPYAMASDSAGRLWFVETGPQPNRFVGFDPGAEAFTDPVPIPSGGGSVRHMHYEHEQGAIWFGTDANTIGRGTLP